MLYHSFYIINNCMLVIKQKCERQSAYIFQWMLCFRAHITHHTSLREDKYTHFYDAAVKHITGKWIALLLPGKTVRDFHMHCLWHFCNVHYRATDIVLVLKLHYFLGGGWENISFCVFWTFHKHSSPSAFPRYKCTWNIGNHGPVISWKSNQN